MNQNDRDILLTVIWFLQKICKELILEKHNFILAVFKSAKGGEYDYADNFSKVSKDVLGALSRTLRIFSYGLKAKGHILRYFYTKFAAKAGKVLNVQSSKR